MPRDFVNFPETEPDVFSVRGLIRWLETQPPETEYDWWDCFGKCLIGNYFSAMGISHTTLYVAVFGGPGSNYSEVCETEPWTYGAALERARKLEADDEHANVPMLGAIGRVMGYEPTRCVSEKTTTDETYQTIMHRLKRYAPGLGRWNDAPGQTASNVASVMRSCAMKG